MKLINIKIILLLLVLIILGEITYYTYLTVLNKEKREKTQEIPETTITLRATPASNISASPDEVVYNFLDKKELENLLKTSQRDSVKNLFLIRVYEGTILSLRIDQEGKDVYLMEKTENKDDEIYYHNWFTIKIAGEKNASELFYLRNTQPKTKIYKLKGESKSNIRLEDIRIGERVRIEERINLKKGGLSSGLEELTITVL